MTKAILSGLLTIVMMAVCPLNTWADETTPEQVEGVYQLKSADDLYWFAAYVNAGNTNVYAALTRDITVNEGVLTDHVYNTPAEGSEFKKWTPIGTLDNPYNGTFDGQGHTVSGLVNTDEDNFIGFFGHIGNATIKNLGVKDTYFRCYAFSGGIAGFCAYHDEDFAFAIESCWFDGLIEGKNNGYFLGGIIGGTYSNEKENMSTIVNCYNLGVIKGSSSSSIMGGIIGFDEDKNVVVRNCYNVGKVSGEYFVGSIAGESCSSIEHCYYLEASATADGVTQNGVGIGYEETPAADKEGETTSATQAQFLSGEICYLLNGNQEKITFGQTVGEGYPSVTSKAVVYAVQPTCKDKATYTNDQAEVVLTQHSLSAKVAKAEMVPGVSDGATFDHYRCSDCGKTFSDADGKNEIEDPTIHDDFFGECTICHRRTKDYAVRIGTVEELFAFAKAINEGTAEYTNAVLTADITVNEGVLTDHVYNTPAEGNKFEEWTPIGTSGYPYHGTFDGNGHTVSGLVNTSESDLLGFFGHIGNATIKNLGVKDTYFRCYAFSGGIAGFCDHSGYKYTFAIENCWFDGLIEGIDDSFDLGGIIGGTWSNEEKKMSTIVNCYNLGTIKAGNSTTDIGGIIGFVNSNNVVVKNCYNVGNVSGYSKVGSIVGGECGPIENCYYLAASTTANGVTQNGVGVNYGSTPDNEGETTSATQEQFESGEICYLLNGDQEKIVFYQEIGADATPVFTSEYMVKKDGDTYVNEKAPLPTAVEKAGATEPSSKAYKTIENGMIVIVKDGQKYDLMGRKL